MQLQNERRIPFKALLLRRNLTYLSELNISTVEHERIKTDNKHTNRTIKI